MAHKGIQFARFCCDKFVRLNLIKDCIKPLLVRDAGWFLGVSNFLNEVIGQTGSFAAPERSSLRLNVLCSNSLHFDIRGWRSARPIRRLRLGKVVLLITI